MRLPRREPPHPTIPRVNLLPPWVFADIETRRLRRRFVLAGCLLVLLLGAGWGFQHLRVTHARQVLAIEQAETSRLTQRTEELAPVRDFVASVERQKQTVSMAMSNEAYTSRVLGELRDTAPSGTDLESVSVTVTGPPAEVTTGQSPAPTSSGGTSPCPGPDPFSTREMVGCLTLSGTASSRATVGDFVIGLGESDFFVEPFISTTTTAGTTRVTFTGSVGLSPRVMTTRYEDMDKLLARRGAR
jgi:Tfp pilus assembly protein PilN